MSDSQKVTSPLKPAALNRADAARHLGITIEQLDAWTENGFLPCIEIEGGFRTYRVATLNKLSPKLSNTPDDHLDLSRFEAPHKRMLYFIRCGDFIKIGITTNILQRYRHLNTANPLPISVFMVGDGDVDLERTIHEDFKELRVKGEWFRNEEPLTGFIDYLYKDFLKVWNAE